MVANTQAIGSIIDKGSYISKHGRTFQIWRLRTIDSDISIHISLIFVILITKALILFQKVFILIMTGTKTIISSGVTSAIS